MKKNICIVADIPGWAFDNIAKKLQKELSHKYNIDIEYYDRRAQADEFFEFAEKVKHYDLVHFLNRRMLLHIGSETFKEKVKKAGYKYNQYVRELKSIFTTAIYDYMDLEKENIKEHTPIFSKYTKMYYTATKKLFDIYSSIKAYPNPHSLVHDICDEKLYFPKNLERFEYDNISNRKIVIGWVGNSNHSGDNRTDLKGFHTIIRPVIDELISEGYEIQENFADRNIVWKAPEEMPDYYNELDLCLCASAHEGTPRPVLESMHSGVPLISTDVGMVPESFGPKQKRFNIGDRENGKNDDIIRLRLKEKITELYNNRHLFKELSTENLNSIKKFDGGKTIKSFDKFFNDFFKNK